LHWKADRHDLVFPVPGPDGTVLALKRRKAFPRHKNDRYVHNLPGHGNPAWCCPGFMKLEPVLVVEGELNGAACWLARPDLAVMGAAGANSGLHLEALAGRVVYVYGDGDDEGQKARDRWAQEAARAGAAEVFVLEPWPVDACKIAGTHGREALAEALTTGMKTAKPLQTASHVANPFASFFCDGNADKQRPLQVANSIWTQCKRGLP
jgi:hypothetical protein